MKHALIFLLTFGLISCGWEGQEALFEVPQPEHAKPMASFDRKLRGKYVACYDENDFLRIDEKAMLHIQRYEFNMLREEIQLDSSLEIDWRNDHEIKQLFFEEGFIVRIHNDTIHAFGKQVDTLFEFNEGQVLKKFRGRYYLNYEEDPWWHVQRVEFNGDSMFFGEITPGDTLLSLDFVSKHEEGSGEDKTEVTTFLISPDKKEFKRLVRSDFFSNIQCYIKQT